MSREPGGAETESQSKNSKEQQSSDTISTIFGQLDGEEKPHEDQQAYHDRRSSKLLKIIMSVIFTWVLGGAFLLVTCIQLNTDRVDIDKRWDGYLQSDPEAETRAQQIASENNATVVTCGTYLENFKELDIKNSSFRSVWLVWFSWQGNDEIDFSDEGFIYYNGIINEITTIRDDVTDDGIHYQQFRVDVSVSQAFHTPRFPLENHILRLYIEPTYDIRDVILVESGDVDNLNKNINVYGYQIENMASTIKYIGYEDNHDDPFIPEGSVTVVSEYMDEIEVNRVGWGLYVKCFIAIWGTTLWVLIMLFVATRHRVDVFAMIPATLFGAVGNIMIGANLLPEALSLGLLEYGNIWGIFIVLAGTVAITILNRERSHWHDNEFADKYGRFMFYSILILAIVGNLALPLVSYQF